MLDYSTADLGVQNTVIKIVRVSVVAALLHNVSGRRNIMSLGFCWGPPVSTSEWQFSVLANFCKMLWKEVAY